MMRNRLLLSSAIAIGVPYGAGLLAPEIGMAQASQEAPATVDAVEEIVVTAQKREQSVQDVPISIAVTTGATMRQAQITNLNDLGNRISGVKVNKAGASDSLNIRGIGSGFNMGFEQSVATFIDGVYLSRSQATRVGFLDLERIEVLKGPQSTYFGSNAIAGALSAVTRKPSQTFEGYASALYAPSDGEYDLQLAVGGPLGEKLSGRAAIRFSGMDGYIRNVRINADGPDNRDVQGRLALRYETPGALDVNWRVDYAHFDDKHAEFQEILNCPPAPGYGAPGAGCLSVIAAGNADNKLDYRTSTGDSFFRLESVSSALNIAWTAGSHTLTSTTGFYWHDITRFTDSPLLAIAGLTGIGKSSGLPIYQREKFRSISQEVRLESEKGGFLEYVLGLYYDDSNLKGGLSFGFYFAPFFARLPGLVAPFTPIAQQVLGDQDQSNRSAFAAATLNLSPELRLNLGARYSSIRKENHRTTIVGFGDDLGRVKADMLLSPAATAAWTGTVGFPSGDYPVTHRTDDKFMPSINVQYDLTSDAMVFASYTTGFKAGGWAIGNTRDFFGPETVKSFEGGIKASWFGRKLTTNISLFNSRYNGLQESTTLINAAGLPVPAIANVGQARVRGVDLEVGIRPFAGASINANIGYLDAKYLEYPNAPCTQLQLLARPTGCTQNLAGKRKAFAPEWSGSVNANYAFELTDDLKAKLGAWVYFTSGYYQQASIDPLFYQPHYAKLDLRAAIAGSEDRWEAAVIAKNVTDKVTSSYRSVMTASNAVTAISDRSRSIAIQLSTKF
ncbi:TonB-dependent receptor [Sphingomonas histidinilytica]|uniref:Outer membrane receptor proteins, mostly Fe transport n=2 Tax=Rhizorhabdus histidinilytica TaxID=439228 RepID=A0A1T4ZSV3_9SPHN|nr:TonB-dependent receptor [Rhizorhabdus histidinilytica]SKB25768.1 Outer membrane receptor proteins, mostly Fe transport [Rhizorhabdus histidinilytica]